MRVLKTFLTILVMVPGFTSMAFSKAAYMGKDDMIKQSVAIAVVNIAKVDKVSTKGDHWTYRKKGSAHVEQIIKGKLPSEFKILGAEDFICAQCQFEPGRYLVFLKKDKELWVGNNWHLSVRPIVNGNVEWFEKTETKPLPEVISEIQTRMKNLNVPR